jgi:hypothetical protein
MERRSTPPPEFQGEAADIASVLIEAAHFLCELEGAEATGAFLARVISDLPGRRQRGRPRGKSSRRWDLCAMILEAEHTARTSFGRAATMSDILKLWEDREPNVGTNENQLETRKAAIRQERKAMQHGPRHRTNPMAGFFDLPIATQQGRIAADAMKDEKRQAKRRAAARSRSRAKNSKAEE